MAKRAIKSKKSPTPKQLVARWVRALESGKYKQGKLELHRVQGGKHFYCCLGVACEVFDRAFPGELNIEDEGKSVSYDGEYADLPKRVREAFGLSKFGGVADGETLVGLNDSGVRFKTIAKIIKSRPAGLFVK